MCIFCLLTSHVQPQPRRADRARLAPAVGVGRARDGCQRGPRGSPAAGAAQVRLAVCSPVAIADGPHRDQLEAAAAEMRAATKNLVVDGSAEGKVRLLDMLFLLHH
jgi:hypothetical protein